MTFTLAISYTLIIEEEIKKRKYDYEKKQTIAVTIAGNDSDGSAGMPADLHSFYARGVYGMGLLTAAVAGNTTGIYAQEVMPLDFIQKQFDVLNDDFKIKAVKTGMLANKKSH